MATKPMIETILDTYTLDELLHLVKLKSDRLIEENTEAMKKHVESFVHQTSEPVRIVSAPKPPKAESPKKPTEKPMSLGAHLLEVLGTKPLKIDEIMSAILARGYKTQSKDLKNMLAHELIRQLKKNTIKKMGYGMYSRK